MSAGPGFAAAVLVGLLASPPAHGESAPKPIAIAPIEPLSFGRLAATGSLAMAVMSPSGERRLQGAIGLDSVYGPAAFLIEGEPGADIAIDLPGRTRIGEGAALVDFRCHCGPLVTLGADGRAEVSIGATLELAPGATPKALNAPFAITVTYR